MNPEERLKMIAEKLERSLKFHREKRDAIRGLNPAKELEEIGAINSLETLWLQLVQEGLIELENIRKGKEK